MQLQVMVFGQELDGVQADWISNRQPVSKRISCPCKTRLCNDLAAPLRPRGTFLYHEAC